MNEAQECPVSSLHRGHANLCIVPILVYVLPKRAQECPVSKPYLCLMYKQVPTCLGPLSCPGYFKTHSHADSHRQIRVTHANICQTDCLYC